MRVQQRGSTSRFEKEIYDLRWRGGFGDSRARGWRRTYLQSRMGLWEQVEAGMGEVGMERGIEFCH
jgi:hypothetical protein